MKKRIKVHVRNKNTSQFAPHNKGVEQLEPLIKENRFDRETAIREKRIGIVFKVIYVIAAFFAALFTSLSSIREGGLTDVYILEAACTGFLLCLLVYMLVYIFNELKCLKLREEAISSWQYEKTEDSYSFVFTYFTLGSIISVLFTIAIGICEEYLTKDLVAIVVTLCAIAASVIGNMIPKRFDKVCCIIGSALWTIVSDGIFVGIILQ